MNTNEILSVICQTTGVAGCFLGDRQGELLAHRMPEAYRMSDLVLALDQAVAFLQPLGGNGVDSTQGVVDCGEHKLIVHKFPFGYLCVLSLASVQTDPLNEEILRIANELLLDGNDVETLRPPVLAPYGDEDPATLPLFT